MTPNDDELLRLYEQMLLIRRSEERLAAGYAAGKVPGSLHLYIGQEAVAVGVCAHLGDRDYVTVDASRSRALPRQRRRRGGHVRRDLGQA